MTDPIRHGRHLGALLSALLTAATAVAQYAPQTLTIGTKQIGFPLHEKLAAVPMRLGSEHPHLVARFEPLNAGDYIRNKYGTFKWTLYVLDFPKSGAVAAPVTGEGGEAAAEPDPRLERLRADDFAQWVKERDATRTDKRAYRIEGKQKRAASGQPASSWWEYTDPASGRLRDALVAYRIAAVFHLDDREVALLAELPAETGDQPKNMNIVRRMLTSVRVTDAVVDDDLSGNRDKYADTPARAEALKRLKDNIGELRNWDYFTSPSYLFTYSWKADNRETKRDMHRFAREMEARLEEIREKFVEFYPPHENVGDAYSVIRVCFDLDDFRKYGNTPPGVVGWFSPSSKELVIYYDQQKVFLKDEDRMLAVCFHEAWHQYADQYFPDVELHRWFDEGLAEYFGSLRKKGGRWAHVPHDGRIGSLVRQERDGKLIPSADIVTWYKDKFYSARAADHYAQAYAMVDFLIRGKDVLGRRWDDSWSKIMPTYAEVCLAEKDADAAVARAFEGIDYAAFEAGWNAWWKDKDIERR